MAEHVTYLRVKALESPEGRYIEGWATTGREDLAGDVVVPEGAKFELPLPLLWNHDTGLPIGAVVSASVTRAGIRIRAKLTEGVAKAEEVWRLLRDGAINAVSVGFRSLDSTLLPNGGRRFDLWDWLELSVCSIPMNPEARVSVAKCAAYLSGDAANMQAPAPDAAWLRSIEPQRPGETEQEAYYRRFDAGLSLLPANLLHLTHVTRADWKDGKLTFRDMECAPLATVDLRARQVSFPADPKPNHEAESRASKGVLDALEMIIRRIVENELESNARLTQLSDRMNAIDGDAANCLKAMEHRIKRIETGGSDGIKFRGYWRDGAIAKVGDAYVYDGSCWRAQRETTDKPSSQSYDWMILARKGRDAKNEAT